MDLEKNILKKKCRLLIGIIHFTVLQISIEFQNHL